MFKVRTLESFGNVYPDIWRHLYDRSDPSKISIALFIEFHRQLLPYGLRTLCSGWQWCRWYRMLVTLRWWLISDVGGRIIMLATFFVMLVAESLCWRLFSLCWWFSQCILSVTDILNGSPTSQTCHQHIWSPTSVTNIDITCAQYAKKRPIFGTNNFDTNFNTNFGNKCRHGRLISTSTPSYMSKLSC